MHRLHLLRHAKSSWKEGGEDHERPLSRRGRDAARKIGRGLPQATGALDLVLCSSAHRTRETLDLVLAAFAPRPHILIERGLYLVSPERMLERLRGLSEEDGNVLLIGHNPSLFELALALTEPDAPAFQALLDDRFPTAARASFRVETRWAALGCPRPALTDYVTPDSLGDEG
ncbi:MAG: SixA phosphatase family protein [Stellaceae bacterium]